MARVSPDDRRMAIVVATRAVMARQGIGGTTVRDVAAELGTSSGLIHHYYDSMDDLVAAAFEQAAREDLMVTREAVEQGVSPIERLVLFFDTYARGEDGSGMQLWLDAWAEAARRPALQRISRRLNEEWQRLLAGIIREGVAAREMACDDPDAAAWRLLSLLDGLTLQVVAHGDVMSMRDADTWARAGAERELALRAGLLSPTLAR